MIGYKFRDTNLLKKALIHKSFGNEGYSSENNERLEFLGDAILDFFVSEILYEVYPDITEGELSRLRAGLVNEKAFSKLAKEMNLGEFLFLGKGEDHTQGRKKASILAGTFEALVAAMYLDGGFESVKTWVRHIFIEKVKLSREEDPLQDYKTRLQEGVQLKYKSIPKYEVIRASGPDHDKVFEVELLIQDRPVSRAIGKTKKEAEQKAAKLAFEKQSF